MPSHCLPEGCRANGRLSWTSNKDSLSGYEWLYLSAPPSLPGYGKILAAGLMAGADGFVLADIINDGASVTFIGSIDGRPAIVYAKHPPLNDKNLEHYISKEHQTIGQNDVYLIGEIDAEQRLGYRLVCPAPEDEIRRLRMGCRYVAETYDEYLARRGLIAPGYVDRLFADPSCRDAAKVYFEDEEFLVAGGEDWSGKEGSLALVLAVKDERYVTVRDVDDPGLVERARRVALGICERLGVDRSLAVIYCDARPCGRRLHFVIRSIATNSFSFPFEGWPILIDEVLGNLSYSADYYKKDVFFLSKMA